MMKPNLKTCLVISTIRRAIVLALGLSLFYQGRSLFADSPEMVSIPGGEFQMGNSFNDAHTKADELPVHLVKVDSFYIGRYEVTNQQYCEYLNSAYAQNMIQVTNGVVFAFGTDTPYCDTIEVSVCSRIIWNGSTFSVVFGKGNHPMARVSWYGAAAYCNWRSKMEGRLLCYDTNWVCDFSANGYRLPTEAEWEYTARGGLARKRYPWADDIDLYLPKFNYYFSFDPYPDPYETGIHPWTTPVGFYNGQLHYKSDFGWPGTQNTYRTGDGINGYGLYDVAGNVWEWCNDWYSDTYYAYCNQGDPCDNPTGPTNGTSRVMRGGSAVQITYECQVHIRQSVMPDARNHYWGFRVALPRKNFMITFDDGPGPISTPYILDQLKNIKKADGTPVKAGFFLVGEDKSRATCYDIWKCEFWRCIPWWPADRCPDPGVISNPDIVKRIANDGHFIGVHTHHHPMLKDLASEDVYSEILDCYEAILATDVDTNKVLKIFRSPYLEDPKNIPPGLQTDWKKIRGDLTTDSVPRVSAEQPVIDTCKGILKRATGFPVVLIFHDFRGLPVHRFNFENIVNQLVKDGYELVDFDPNTTSEELDVARSNTLCGDDILVVLPTYNCIQFSKVVSAGETKTTIVETGPVLPSDYVLQGAYFDVTTTAAYSGPITVTFPYDSTSMSYETQKWSKLLHYRNGRWVDITDEDQPYITDGMISGTVDNLSLFAVAYPSADLNHDRRVNFSDFATLGTHWLDLDCKEDNNWCDAADLNISGRVDSSDVVLFADHWLEGTSP